MLIKIHMKNDSFFLIHIIFLKCLIHVIKKKKIQIAHGRTAKIRSNFDVTTQSIINLSKYIKVYE